MKINVNDPVKLEAAIDAVQARASARKINILDIAKYVEKIEYRLGDIMHKKDWKGVKFWVDPNAGTFPGSYNGTPLSTQFCLQRGASAWFVTSIGRSECKGPQGRIYPVLTDGHASAIIGFLSDSKTWS